MKTFELYVTFDGIICVNAETEEEAIQKAKDMSDDMLIKKSSGTWDIDSSGVDYDI